MLLVEATKNKTNIPQYCHLVKSRLSLCFAETSLFRLIIALCFVLSDAAVIVVIMVVVVVFIVVVVILRHINDIMMAIIIVIVIIIVIIVVIIVCL